MERRGSGSRWWLLAVVAAVVIAAAVLARPQGPAGQSTAPPGNTGAGANATRGRDGGPGPGGVPDAVGGPALRFGVDVPSALLMDAGTGQILYEKNADERLHPASLVKIMTMLVALDAVERGYAGLEDPVRISARAAGIGGSQVYLAEGETFTLEQLLRAVAIASANDAAVAVAEHIAGSQAAFVDAMNRRAAELGLKKTRFVNPDGLPPDQGEDPNLTTAREMALLARELIARHPGVLQWTSVRTQLFRERPRFVLINTNQLVGTYPGLDGLKTGHTTQAGYSVVATAARDGRRLIAVTMKAPDDASRVSQTARLLDYGFRAFQPVVVALKGEQVGELRLRSGSPERVPVEATQTLRALTLGGEAQEAERRLEFRNDLTPPLKQGQVVGYVVATVQGKDAGRVPVATTRAMGRAGRLTTWWRWARDTVTGRR